uniref:Nuclear receptor domain-containing protein n=1 Tax=Steinernema glaseri TaxID=37863 RepID=A0A1I7ZMM1_9BILA
MTSSSGSPSDTIFCLICGGEASGIRFDVNACRACAAFFRRSVEVGHKYKCRRGTKGCDVSKEAFLQCRYCRYQRCKEVGMSIGRNARVKLLNTSSEEPEEPEASTSQSYMPNEGLTAFEGHKLKFDEALLLDEVSKILGAVCILFVFIPQTYF